MSWITDCDNQRLKHSHRKLTEISEKFNRLKKEKVKKELAVKLGIPYD
jgi:hypothetical protein